MTREYEHLALEAASEPLPRPKRRGGSSFRRDAVSEHGAELLAEAEQLREALETRSAESPPQINPKLIFKLELAAGGNVDEANLSTLGLRLLARAPGKAVVVFPNEASLASLRTHLAGYSQQDDDGSRYRFLDSVDAVSEITAEDRIGPILAASPLNDGAVDHLDLELYRPDTYEEARQWVSEIEALAGSRDATAVTDWLIGDYLCLLRVRCDEELATQLLETDYVKQLERRPRATFERIDVDYFPADAQIDLGSLGEDTPGVVVIDSGVAQAHPLLGPALGDAQVFGHLPGTAAAGPEDVDRILPGHGTAVSGIATYGSLVPAVMGLAPRPTARLFSARVTDDDGEYDETELLETQLTSAVEYFLEHYPQARVFNISLGNADRVFADGYQFRLAALIDQLAYRHRDREILFTISSGNYSPSLDYEGVLEQYPGYLRAEEARILDPATSAIAITVGGLSAGAATDPRFGAPGVERPVAGVAGYPSPFTRRGPGVDGAIKPEVVDSAGDSRFERGMIAERPAHVGVPTTSSQFGPPTGHLLKLVAGTSFSAPRVANLAARLFDAFPGASSNLIRALIAESARIPDAVPTTLADMPAHAPDILNIYGYGQPDYERARWSAENAVLLAVEDALDIDSFRIFEIPPLPREFLERRGAGYLTVTLAFDPPTRHTRSDSYLGVTMQTRLVRNSDPEGIAAVMRTLTTDERANLAEGEDPPALSRLRGRSGEPTKIDLFPGPRTREKGTLQRGTARVSSRTWSYNGDSLHLIVIAQRKWAPEDITQQRFAVVVSVSHDDPALDLYASLRARSRLFTRVRARV